MVEVVAALLTDGRRFFIAQRPTTKSRALLWEFVGGKVEAGETREEALVRECREELGITVTVGEPFFDVTHEYPDVTVHLSVFRATTDESPKMLEHNDFCWITPEAIDGFDFCPADTEILAKIKKEL